MRLHLAENSAGGEFPELVRRGDDAPGDARRVRRRGCARHAQALAPDTFGELARDVRGRREDAGRGDAREGRVRARHRRDRRVPLRRRLPQQCRRERRHRLGDLLGEGFGNASRDPGRRGGRDLGPRRDARRRRADHEPRSGISQAREREEQPQRDEGGISAMPRLRFSEIGLAVLSAGATLNPRCAPVGFDFVDGRAGLFTPWRVRTSRHRCLVPSRGRFCCSQQSPVPSSLGTTVQGSVLLRPSFE